MQERKGYATWSGGKRLSSQEFSDKNKNERILLKKKGVLLRGTYKKILKERTWQ